MTAKAAPASKGSPTMRRTFLAFPGAGLRIFPLASPRAAHTVARMVSSVVKTRGRPRHLPAGARCLLFVAAMLFVGCKAEQGLVLVNRSGRPIVVKTSHTRQSVRVKDGGVRTVPHSVGTLTITQEGGGVWQYDPVAIYDYQDQLWRRRRWIFIPVRNLHLVVQTNGVLVVQPPKGREPAAEAGKTAEVILPKSAAPAASEQKSSPAAAK